MLSVWRRSLLVLLVSLACGGGAFLASRPAQAQNEDARERARSHFEAGRALYNLKNYSDAIREFSAGYQLSQLPLFLVNLGQSYRRIGEGSSNPDAQRAAFTQARAMYKKFLDDTPPGRSERDQVQQILVEIDGLIAALPPPSIAPPVTNTAPEPSPEPAALVVAAPPRKSFIRRNWWIFPVAAVVVAGVAVGVYFGTRPSGVDCSSASLGCLDASH